MFLCARDFCLGKLAKSLELFSRHSRGLRDVLLSLLVIEPPQAMPIESRHAHYLITNPGFIPRL